MKILIANDPAFNFTYRANVDALRQIGSVRFFSPMRDDHLPPCDLLYLPGGYPELFLDALAGNHAMREQIKDYAEKGGRIFAECGGFMYLCNEIDQHPMCGVLPLRATMQGARLHLGYRRMEWMPGHVVKGHEFHYSSIVDEPRLSDDGIACDEGCMTMCCSQHAATGRKVDTPVYRYKNVVAGYTHWYWADMEPGVLRDFFSIK